ncbi:hypothetical protein LOZ65_005050 [Ophidiomyces ophidiicola]|nr:hypothetical protein LOZ65_005050 [Ophidiomyces ophidiicola]
MKLSCLSLFLSLCLYLSPGASFPVSPAINNALRRTQLPIAPADQFLVESKPVDDLTTIKYDDNHQESPLSMSDWSTTHLLARRLLARSSTGILSTVYPKAGRDPSLAGVPVGLPDYYADCASQDDPELHDLLGPGNPLILALNLGTSFRNAKAGSNISLAIDWWHKGPSNNDGSLDTSPSALPRLSLIGSLQPIPTTLPAATKKAIEKCFLAVHADAKHWLPGSPDAAHSGYWARIVVEKAFWVGGFGDRARIGWLNPRTWRGIEKNGKDGERGWADVRLPGEKP